MSREKQIEEMAEIICDARQKSVYSVEIAEQLYNAGYRKQSEVIEKYRQKVNVKMGKHTDLFSKDYIQRILLEVAKEMKNE